jgi:hypothetical protein
VRIAHSQSANLAKCGAKKKGTHEVPFSISAADLAF